MEKDITAQILSNIIKFHTVCISQMSVFEVVLKYQSQTIYITNIYFGHNMYIFVYGLLWSCR
jgi:hypothetical protein